MELNPPLAESHKPITETSCLVLLVERSYASIRSMPLVSTPRESNFRLAFWNTFQNPSVISESTDRALSTGESMESEESLVDLGWGMYESREGEDDSVRRTLVCGCESFLRWEKKAHF
jgi:hypothetical protein